MQIDFIADRRRLSAWASPSILGGAPRGSTQRTKRGIVARMVVTVEIGAGQLADLVKRVQAGDEVLLTQGNKPVAKLVHAGNETVAPRKALPIRSLKGHRVLTPAISQAELAGEMYCRRKNP